MGEELQEISVGIYFSYNNEHFISIDNIRKFSREEFHSNRYVLVDIRFDISMSNKLEKFNNYEDFTFIKLEDLNIDDLPLLFATKEQINHLINLYFQEFPKDLKYFRKIKLDKIC